MDARYFAKLIGQHLDTMSSRLSSYWLTSDEPFKAIKATNANDDDVTIHYCC